MTLWKADVVSIETFSNTVDYHFVLVTEYYTVQEWNVTQWYNTQTVHDVLKESLFQQNNLRPGVTINV